MPRTPRFASLFAAALLASASAARADDPPAQPPPVQPPPVATPGQPAQPPPAQPPPGYGQPPPGYGQPPPGYGQPPPGYGQPPPGSPQVMVSQPPPGYYPPPGGYYPGYPPYPYPPRDTRPLVLEYEEGQPIPNGYRLDSRINRGLLGAGAGVFGGLWFLSAVVGLQGDEDTFVGDGGWAALYVPLFGPFIAIDTLRSSDAGTVLLMIDGLGQLGGATMLTLSFILKSKRLVREDLSVSVAPGVHVTPYAGPRSFGLTGTF